MGIQPRVLSGGVAYLCDITMKAQSLSQKGGWEGAGLAFDFGGEGASEGWCRTYRFGKAHTAHGSVKHPQAQHV